VLCAAAFGRAIARAKKNASPSGEMAKRYRSASPSERTSVITAVTRCLSRGISPFLFRDLECELLDLAEQTQHVVVVASHDGDSTGRAMAAIVRRG
jgi:hypothetical protein